jgi:hypothetical protein
MVARYESCLSQKFNAAHPMGLGDPDAHRSAVNVAIAQCVEVRRTAVAEADRALARRRTIVTRPGGTWPSATPLRARSMSAANWWRCCAIACCGSEGQPPPRRAPRMYRFRGV